MDITHKPAIMNILELIKRTVRKNVVKTQTSDIKTDAGRDYKLNCKMTLDIQKKTNSCMKIRTVKERVKSVKKRGRLRDGQRCKAKNQYQKRILTKKKFIDNRKILLKIIHEQIER